MLKTATRATLLVAETNREQSANFRRAVELGGAVLCHRRAHRRNVSEPSEADQWVAYEGGVFQGVWYHKGQVDRFLGVRGWEIQK